ncbi:MAG TPA: hypothetical protein VM733_17800 [Thermoanaerobaculia bacterium]|nr:hypothetical protein [Thermoanaerobaculia bacterium]
MKFRNLISTAAIALLPIVASAATIIIPAAGTGPGASGSQWQSELTLYNAAPRATTLSLTFHQGRNVLGPVNVTLQARATASIADVVKSKFGVDAGTGAIEINVEDRAARSLAITSRTFNTSATGEFGQDIPATDVVNAARAGELAALPGPSSIDTNRFNFGVYAVDATNVTWELVRANGTVAATKTASYAAGEHAQYGFGVTSLLGATPADNDTVAARVTAGKAIFYGSIINGTGDPTFVPGVRTREDVIINFIGLDLDEDGTVDIADANHDGVLDAPINVFTSLFPDYFRIVAEGEFDETLSYTIVKSPATKSDLLDANGLVRLIAAGDLKNTAGELQVKITTGASESIITIPVKFQ